MTKPTDKQPSLWLIFQSNTLLIASDTPQTPTLSLTDIEHLHSLFIRQHYLGSINHIDLYCAELTEEIVLPPHIHTIPLKKALELFHTDWYGLAAKAYTILNWDRNHQFCGRCGNQTQHISSSFELICKHCQLTFYPRISPSIIVLIHRNDDILMARSSHFPPGAYGLIAGFVEAGENIEEAVHREVLEEGGIHIHQLEYFGSQPWPFPDSLMIAFTAAYHSGELNINKDEIEEAGWYHYKQLPGYPSTSVSIARQLIDQFIQQQIQKEKDETHGSV